MKIHVTFTAIHVKDKSRRFCRFRFHQRDFLYLPKENLRYLLNLREKKKGTKKKYLLDLLNLRETRRGLKRNIC